MIEKKKTTLIAEDFFTEIEKFSVKKGMIKIKKFSFFRKINGEISITIMTRKGKPTWWAEARGHHHVSWHRKMNRAQWWKPK